MGLVEGLWGWRHRLSEDSGLHLGKQDLDLDRMSNSNSKQNSKSVLFFFKVEWGRGVGVGEQDHGWVGGGWALNIP